MELKFGLLADYAAPGQNGKLILVGLFETMLNTGENPGIKANAFFLVAQFEAHVTEGAEHKVAIQLQDADGGNHGPRIEGEFRFTPQGPGRPMRGTVLIGFQGFPIPPKGDYAFHVLIDNRHMTAIPLFITDQPVPSGG